MKILIAMITSCFLMVGTAVAGNFYDLGGQDIGPYQHKCWGYLPKERGPADLDVLYRARCIIQSDVASRVGLEISGQPDVDRPITLNGGPVWRLNRSDHNVLLINGLTFHNKGDLFCLYNRSPMNTIRANCSLHER